MLQPYATCAELEQTIEDTLVLQMKASLEEVDLPVGRQDGAVVADEDAGVAGRAFNPQSRVRSYPLR